MNFVRWFVANCPDPVTAETVERMKLAWNAALHIAACDIEDDDTQVFGGAADHRAIAKYLRDRQA